MARVPLQKTGPHLPPLQFHLLSLNSDCPHPSFPLSVSWAQWYPAKSKQLFSDVDFDSSQVKKKKQPKLPILLTSSEVKGILCSPFHRQWKKRAVVQSIFTGQTD